MEFEEIKHILEQALENLITYDNYLLEHDVHEQTVTGRLACYLSNSIPSISNNGWHVDTEYNRNGDVPKSLSKIGNVKPDILIHRRSYNNPEQTEDNNLLIIEVKKNPTKIDQKQDLRKIEAFISEAPYYYKFGAFIAFRTNGYPYEIIWRLRDSSQNAIHGEDLF